MTHKILPALLAALLCSQLHAHPGTDVVLEYFNNQIRQNPRDQLLYVQRGIAYSEDGHYEEALADFQHAVTLGDPGVVDFELGVLFYRMGHTDRARAYLDQLLKRVPSHLQGLEYRAKVLQEQGEIEAALVDLKHMLELSDRPNPGHYISAAQMLQANGPDGVTEALSILDEGIKKLGLTPQLQQYAIALEVARRNTRAAIERQRSLKPLLGESPGWKIDLAELLMQNDETKEASSLLLDAAKQLDTLRKTPARLRLAERITELRVKQAGGR